MLPLILAVLAAQTPYSQAPSPEVYQAPVVRPFEPPAALEAAEGDASGPARRGALEAAVTVDAYRRSYEAPSSGAEAAYEQGVAQAERNADALSGPLDGRWIVRDREGRTLLRLVLNDRGGGRPVEGAWMAEPASGQRSRGLIGPSAQDGGPVTLTLEGAGRLVLTGRHAGRLERDGHSEAVTLVRPG